MKMPNICIREMTTSSRNSDEKLNFNMQEMKLDFYLSSCIKLNSKNVKDLNIKPGIQNLTEGKVENCAGNLYVNLTQAIVF